MIESFKFLKRDRESQKPVPLKQVHIEGKEPFDATLPTFNFTEKELVDLKSAGKSDEEIEVARRAIINRQARAHLEKNQLDG